jgi:hypothetical protein
MPYFLEATERRKAGRNKDVSDYPHLSHIHVDDTRSRDLVPVGGGGGKHGCSRPRRLGDSD